MFPTRRSAVAFLAASVSLAAAPLASAAVPAPAFSALDDAGKTRTLAEFRGKTVVLEWTNEGCPYVQKHYGTGNMQALQKQAAKDGVVWLTIASSKPGAQGHVGTPAAAQAWKAKHGAAPTAVLLDGSGAIGRAFDAKTTPDIRVIDAKGNLVYAGAIDDKVSTKPEDVKTAKNYLTAALADVKAGRPVATPITKPYGCGIKY